MVVGPIRMVLQRIIQMKVRRLLVTRKECREMGLDVSNTQFARWEEQGLLVPFKAGGHRAAIVRYRLRDVLRFIVTYSRRKDPLFEDS